MRACMAGGGRLVCPNQRSKYIVTPMNTCWKLRHGPAAGLFACLLVLWPARPAAHEVPANVTVLVFARPEGKTLRLLVRAPLESMRDMNWPLRGPGYLELDQLTPHLESAGKTWIADYLELFENG